MEIRDAEAQSGGGLEAPGGSVHADCGRSEWVFGWEEKSSPVLTIFVRSVRRTG